MVGFPGVVSFGMSTSSFPNDGDSNQSSAVQLDGRNRVRRIETVASGGATSSFVPVREVLSIALRHDAAAIAVAHNHPGGGVEPSAEDVAVTRRLRQACGEVGLRFLDHVIIAGDEWCSVTASR